MIAREKKKYDVFPSFEEIYTVFNLCKPENVKVIIIGQDPYHVPGAAMGIAFGHHDNRIKMQPSLRNIFIELKSDGFKPNMSSGDLSYWVSQGVFLINTALSVRKSEANSHSDIWKSFINNLFKFLNKKCDHLVVIMWGTPAKSYSHNFNNEKHKKIMSVHPSPLSAPNGFFGSKPFSKTNGYLTEFGLEPIDWDLVD